MKTRYRKDLTGQRFGRLVVIGFKEFKGHYSFWSCLCDCGKTKDANISALKLSRTMSCGCLHSEQTKKAHRKEPGKAESYRLYSEYKQSAKRRNINFELTQEEFLNIAKENCFYCGCTPNQFHQADKTCSEEWRILSKFFHNGVDRVDNNKGYILNNCVACCKDCNIGKGIKTVEEFKNWIERAYNNLCVT